MGSCQGAALAGLLGCPSWASHSSLIKGREGNEGERAMRERGEMERVADSGGERGEGMHSPELSPQSVELTQNTVHYPAGHPLGEGGRHINPLQPHHNQG